MEPEENAEDDPAGDGNFDDFHEEDDDSVHNDGGTFDHILNPPKLDPCFIPVVEKDDVLALDVLLADASVNPGAGNNLLIRKSAEAKCQAVVQRLLLDARVDPTAADNAALHAAVSHGCAPIVSLLLADSRINVLAKCRALLDAAGCSHEDVLQIFLADADVNPAYEDNAAIIEACGSGHAKSVALLLNDPRVDPGAQEQEAIVVAASEGYADTVSLLLADPRVHPQARDNNAVVSAAEAGHTAVVALLLADPRVDPAANNNEALICAAQGGHEAAVALFLADPRVDPAANDNEALIECARLGRASVVKLLLADHRVDPTARNNLAIRVAAENERSSVVEVLLADARVDPTAESNAALEAAATLGDVEVLKMLLADARVTAGESTVETAQIAAMRSMYAKLSGAGTLSGAYTQLPPGLQFPLTPPASVLPVDCAALRDIAELAELELDASGMAFIQLIVTQLIRSCCHPTTLPSPQSTMPLLTLEHVRDWTRVALNTELADHALHEAKQACFLQGSYSHEEASGMTWQRKALQRYAKMICTDDIGLQVSALRLGAWLLHVNHTDFELGALLGITAAIGYLTEDLIQVLRESKSDEERVVTAAHVMDGILKDEAWCATLSSRLDVCSNHKSTNDTAMQPTMASDSMKLALGGLSAIPITALREQQLTWNRRSEAVRAWAACA